ncbi:hypothetical protein BJY04DRAFT_217089 [Aspergillus karnatakaensis]|uniref:uncharacterized protein n=1 Tax=Aspergillus karnatakaensis TaxID=1810916 RepID=UPI003CCD9673
MLLARPTTIRTGTRGASALGRTPAQFCGRRTYADAHAVNKKSDLPWAIISLGVSVPTFYWLWQSGAKKAEHHDGHGHEGDKH